MAVLTQNISLFTTTGHVNNKHQNITEVCQRISTLTNGGNWIIGRKYNFSNKYLYVIVENCMNMNDLYIVYEYIKHLFI